MDWALIVALLVFVLVYPLAMLIIDDNLRYRDLQRRLREERARRRPEVDAEA